MRKFDDHTLKAILKALEHGDWAGEADLSRFVFQGYDYEDLHYIFDARRYLLAEPELTAMGLLARGISWSTQQRLFGGIENLKALLGIDAASHDIEELDDNYRDVLMVACWKALTPHGYVLCNMRSSEEDCIFLHPRTGKHITTRFRRL